MMNNTYPFFKDELALLEIRKHKWIQSEILGHEVGFATAAVDWIKKYGAAWKIFRLGLTNSDQFLSERRKYRRFVKHFPLELNIDNQPFQSHSWDFNLVGVGCVVPRFIKPENAVTARIKFQGPNQSEPIAQFEFNSRITQIAEAPQKEDPAFRIFIPFSEEIRDYLRTHANILSN